MVFSRRTGSGCCVGAVAVLRAISVFIFHPRGAGVVVTRRDFWAGDGAVSSPGCVRSTRPSQSAIGPCDWGFHTVRGDVDPGKLDFRPRDVGVVYVWKYSEPGMGPNPPRVRRHWEGCPEGQLPPRACRPLIGRVRVGGDPSAHGIGARKTQG